MGMNHARAHAPSVAITVSADRLHPPPTDRNSPQAFQTFQRPIVLSIQTKIAAAAAPHNTIGTSDVQYRRRHGLRTERPPPGPPTQAAHPFLSPFLLPNLS